MIKILIFTLGRETIDSAFGYSYSKKVLQHQNHHQSMSIILKVGCFDINQQNALSLG